MRQIDPASFERVLDINLNGVFRTLKYATPHLERSRGHVTRAVVVANWLKAALNSPVAWPWTRRFAAQAVPALEREVEVLGRNDQLVLEHRTTAS